MANEIALQSEERKHPLDENLRPLKIGNKTAPLELSNTDVRVNNLQVSGTTSGVSASDATKLPLAGGTMTGDITTDSNIVSTDLAIDDSGDITLDADGGEIYLKDGGTTFGRFSTAGPYTGITLYEDGGATDDDYFEIRTRTQGGTEVRTVDDAAQAAHLTLNADGNVLIGCYPGASITLQENDGTEYTPQLNTDATTKKYVDESHTIKQAEVTISEAEMDALHSTEKELVAAQGSNMVIIPVSLVLFVDRDSSTTQGNTGNLDLGVSGATGGGAIWGQQRRFMWNESGDRVLLISLSGEALPGLTDGDNRPLTLKLTSAITSGSIDSVKCHITYYVYDNS